MDARIASVIARVEALAGEAMETADPRSAAAAARGISGTKPIWGEVVAIARGCGGASGWRATGRRLCQ